MKISFCGINIDTEFVQNQCHGNSPSSHGTNLQEVFKLLKNINPLSHQYILALTSLLTSDECSIVLDIL